LYYVMMYGSHFPVTAKYRSEDLKREDSNKFTASVNIFTRWMSINIFTRWMSINIFTRWMSVNICLHGDEREEKIHTAMSVNIFTRRA
jgi:hypothetical protein